VLSWAKPCRDESRITLPRLLPGNSYKHLDDARVGRVTWPRLQWRHAFQQRRNNWSVSRVSDQGFIGETEARLRVSSWWEIAGVLDGRQLWNVRSWRRADRVNWRLHVSSFQLRERIIAAVRIPLFKVVLGMICEECFCEEKIYVWHLKCETVVASVLRAVAGRRLVEFENPSACATVCCKWCKRVIALYFLYVSGIRCECVTKC
jgi:hypothetical protein